MEDLEVSGHDGSNLSGKSDSSLAGLSLTYSTGPWANCKDFYFDEIEDLAVLKVKPE